MSGERSVHPLDPNSAKAKAPTINPRNEAEFLKRQSDHAAVAMNRAMDEAKAHFANAFSLKTMAREHPLATVAAGLVAGFATGAAVTTSQRDSALNRLAEIERALNPQAAAGQADNGKPAGPSLMTTMLKEAFNLAKPILTSSITAMVAAQRAASAAAEEVDEQQESSLRNDGAEQH